MGNVTVLIFQLQKCRNVDYNKGDSFFFYNKTVGNSFLLFTIVCK